MPLNFRLRGQILNRRKRGLKSQEFRVAGPTLRPVIYFRGSGGNQFVMACLQWKSSKKRQVVASSP